MFSVETVRQQLAKLLPTGICWDEKNIPETWLYQVLEAFSFEPHRFMADAIVLLNQLNPRFASELLPVWESELGLPEPCDVGTQLTLLERQQRAYSKLTLRFTPTIVNLQNLLIENGYNTTTITEYDAGLDAGGNCEQPCWSDAWACVLLVSGPDIAVISEFRAGDNAGLPLRVWSNTDALKCLLGHYRPAHSYVFYNYT